MKITILYFAQLREQAGKDAEARETAAASPQALYEELAAAYGFKLRPQDLRVAVNDEFVPMETPLHEGDEVAYIPPVAGG